MNTNQMRFDLAVFEAFLQHDDDGTLAVSNVLRLGSRSLFGFEYDSGYNIFDDMFDNMPV